MKEDIGAKYLGVMLTQDKRDMLNKYRADIIKNTRREASKCYIPARATARQILYGCKIWSTYAVPRILHGIAAIPYYKCQFDDAEKAEREYIRWISKQPRHTSLAALYGETNILPLTYIADKLTINYLYHIQKLNDDNMVKLIFLEMKSLYENTPSKTSWLKHAIKICEKYNLNPFMPQSKQHVRKTIYDTWIVYYKTLAENKSSLVFYDKTDRKLTID
jgi:hypothetical protein